MGANDLWGEANLDPRNLIGRIYVGNHKTLLHTKYISCTPHGFIEEDYFFPIISLWELMIPGHGQFRPKGLDWHDLCRAPLKIAPF